MSCIAPRPALCCRRSGARAPLTLCSLRVLVCPSLPSGYGVQALSTGEGALGSLAKFAEGLNSGK